MWEFFEDLNYYCMWAVRKVGDKDFNSRQLFHVQTKDEAIALSGTLNEYELRGN